IFRIMPENILRVCALPIAVIYYLLLPVVIGVNAFSEFIFKKILKTDFQEIKPVFTRIDLGHYVDKFVKSEENSGEEQINPEIFENVLYLTEVKARECMVPRNEVEAVDVSAPLSELQKKFSATRLSRILVFEENIDNIIGYVHHLSLLKNPKTIREILFPLTAIPETMPARDVLSLFKKNNKTIVLVLDEYGGTAGIVTMEDVLEEIFGEIDDEHDVPEHTEQQVDENDFVFAGRLEVDYLNEKYKLN